MKSHGRSLTDASILLLGGGELFGIAESAGNEGSLKPHHSDGRITGSTVLVLSIVVGDGPTVYFDRSARFAFLGPGSGRDRQVGSRWLVT